MKLPPFLKKASTGFSLVEVTLALGIIAFALVPIVATLPIGLGAANEAIEKTTFSQIVRQIGSDLNKLQFNEVPDFLDEKLRFTWEGKPASSLNQAIYEVSLSKALASYPGSNSLTGLDQQLQRIILDIRRPSNPAVLYRTSITIANPGS